MSDDVIDAPYGPESGVWRERELNGAAVTATQVAAVLGARDGQTTFPCPVPTHRRRGQATISDDGDHVERFVCDCKGEQREALGTVYASWFYGRIPKLSGVETALWTRLLLWDALGRPPLPEADLPPLADDAPAHVAKAYHGRELQVGLWAGMEMGLVGRPSPFARAFVGAWCRLRGREPQEAIDALKEMGVLVKAEQKGRTPLYESRTLDHGEDSADREAVQKELHDDRDDDGDPAVHKELHGSEGTASVPAHGRSQRKKDQKERRTNDEVHPQFPCVSGPSVAPRDAQVARASAHDAERDDTRAGAQPHDGEGEEQEAEADNAKVIDLKKAAMERFRAVVARATPEGLQALLASARKAGSERQAELVEAELQSRAKEE